MSILKHVYHFADWSYSSTYSVTLGESGVFLLTWMSFCGWLLSVRWEIERSIFLTYAHLDSTFCTLSLDVGLFANIWQFCLDSVNNKPLLYFLQRSARCCKNKADMSVLTYCCILTKHLHCHSYQISVRLEMCLNTPVYMYLRLELACYTTVQPIKDVSS